MNKSVYEINAICSVVGVGIIILHSIWAYIKYYRSSHREIRERSETGGWLVHPLYVGSVSLFMFPDWLLFKSSLTVVLGWYLLGLGIVLACFSRTILGREWSPYSEVHTKHKWISSGPYRFFSHPLYIGEIVAVFGAFFMTGHGYLLIALAVLIPTLMHKAHTETTLLYKYLGPPPIIPLSKRLLCWFKNHCHGLQGGYYQPQKLLRGLRCFQSNLL